MRTKGFKALVKAVIPSGLICYRGPASRNQVALTFDDGPAPNVTNELVRQLRSRGHKATFFVLGRAAEAYPGLLDCIKEGGCEIGNHSYSHVVMSQLSHAQINAEVERTDRVLGRSIDDPSWFRPPGGRLSWNLVLYLRRRRFKTTPILWSVCVPHEHKKSPKELVDVMRAAVIVPGDIVLLHDDYPTIATALPLILDLLEERGLRSVSLSELLKRNSFPVAAGEKAVLPLGR